MTRLNNVLAINNFCMHLKFIQLYFHIAEPLYYDSKQYFAGPFGEKGYVYQNLQVDVLLSLFNRNYSIGMIYGKRW